MAALRSMIPRFALAIAPACVLHDGPPITVSQAAAPRGGPASWTTPLCKRNDFGQPSSALCAGAAEVDITPPPGLPTYGYSTNGAASATGYWLRLKARILVFEKPDPPPDGGSDAPSSSASAQSSETRRIVLIQADLGAASELVQRKLANALSDEGIDPTNLMFATTHTHGGPGGFFGDKFYNKSVGAVPAFIPQYVDTLVASMKGGVKSALLDLKPAHVGVGTAQVDPSASHNRSYDGWVTNFQNNGACRPPKSESVDHTLRLLRVDTMGHDQAYRPRALWSVFAVHGTSMAPGYPLFHGDVHGLAARLTEHWIDQQSGSSDFVAAMANGAEGDVSPGTLEDVHGKDLTMKAAGFEAVAALKAFHSLDEHMDGGPTSIDYAYEETSLRGAGTKLGHLCEVGVLGASEAGGSEESRGPLYGFLGMVEGSPRDPYGCEATKDKVGGGLQDLFYQPSEYPDLVPFQIIAFGDRSDAKGLFLAAFPGEPTTEVGRMVERQIARHYQGTVAVVGLTNSYATYFTTPSEYLHQDYEGGATLYGPYQGLFAAEQLSRVADWIGAAPNIRPATHAFPNERVFQAGEAKPLYPKESACHLDTWRASKVSRSEVPLPNRKGSAPIITFQWRGMSKDEMCGLASIDVECGKTEVTAVPHPLIDDRGYSVDDEGFDFEVWRDGDSTWNAAWAAHGKSPGQCRFVVRHAGMAPLVSEPFELPR